MPGKSESPSSQVRDDLPEGEHINDGIIGLGVDRAIVRRNFRRCRRRQVCGRRCRHHRRRHRFQSCGKVHPFETLRVWRSVRKFATCLKISYGRYMSGNQLGIDGNVLFKRHAHF